MAEPPSLPGVTHRRIAANGISLHVAEAGEGPAVLLCHGWPELWWSWRHQIGPLARAGFRVIVPDMRGYGGTDAPAEIERYTIFDHVGDMVALLGALGVGRAAIVGHDWGAPVAWHAAQMRPDLFRAVAGLSVPIGGRGGAPITRKMREAGYPGFYINHFQAPGVAEAEFERDLPAALRRLYHSLSGDLPEGQYWRAVVPPGKTILDILYPAPPSFRWMSEAEFAVYVETFVRTGMRGGLNWYRNVDRNWALMAAFDGRRIEAPALFLGGERDSYLRVPGVKQVLGRLRDFAPNLVASEMLPVGHWIQQEAPEETNRALIAFLKRVLW